jgi:hypothetical protein
MLEVIDNVIRQKLKRIQINNEKNQTAFIHIKIIFIYKSQRIKKIKTLESIKQI